MIYKLLIFSCFSLLNFNVIFAKSASLSDRATNPITNLSQLQLENDFSPKNYGTKDYANIVTIKPLIAINKNQHFAFEQLIRLKIQIPYLPNSSQTKKGTFLGDTQFFDLFITEESWGRWGVGPMMIFPTANKLEAGQGKWQVGPALGVSVLKYPKWQFGFLAQNPISFAGNKHKAHQNYLLFQPFVIYHFLRNSYIESNAEWTIDWANHANQIPVNIGIGHTFTSHGEFKLDTLLQFEWLAYKNALEKVGYMNQYTIQLCFSILFD